MELTTIIKIEQICRICLNETEDANSIDVKMFESCTGINITETPQSTQICLKCASSLNDLFIFRRKCIESHESLIKMQNKIEIIETDSNEPFEEHNVDEYQMSDGEMENEEELVEVLFICEEEDQACKDKETESYNEEVSNISDLETTTFPKKTETSKSSKTEEDQDFNEMEHYNDEVSDISDFEIKTSPKKPRKLRSTKTKNDQDCKDEVSDVSDFEIKTFPKKPRKLKSTKTKKDQDCKDEVSDISDLNTSPKKSKKSKSTNTKETKVKRNPMASLICPYCGQKHSSTYMKVHIRNTHSEFPEKLSIECKICNSIFKNKEALKCHMIKHSGHVYACKLCDKTYKNWSTRRRHMSVAHGESFRYNCNICDHKNDNSHRFATHMRQHTGELPFECKECNKKFICKRNLNNHMFSHSEERNVLCEYCNKAFKQLRHLRSHIKIHTQERNYVCPVESCRKSFIQNHVLKSHIRTNHAGVDIPPSGTIVSIKRTKNVTAEEK